MFRKDYPPAKVTSNVVRCARCGRDHPKMEFDRLFHAIKSPAGDMTHWATCPVSGEPILFGYVNWETKFRKDMIRATLVQLWLRPSTGFSNARFLLGMWVGGFEAASRKFKD